MDRRLFIQSIAVATAGMNSLPALADIAGKKESPLAGMMGSGLVAAKDIDIEGHSLLCSFHRNAESWKVYEDLRTRDSSITFVAANGSGRVLTRNAEAAFADAEPPYLGLSISDIGMSGPDLLADKLLQNGDPDPEQVCNAAPPMGSYHEQRPGGRVGWETIVGTRECQDTMPVYPSGNTRTYHPVQSFPELNGEMVNKRFDGLVGGWMPAVRKVMPDPSSSAHYEVIVFGDVLAKDKFIVQTWHRTVRVEDGKIVKAEYGYSYPPFPPRQQNPEPEAFYRGLFEFCLYWENLAKDVAPAALPQKVWVDMAKYAFVKEQVVRPGGYYPKYGAVDRDYYGPEYDGFQDIFTSSLYSNLEWGRFDMAKAVLDNYYSDFVNEKGMINMRGAETAQFGLALSLIARYYNYTGDKALLMKHRAKIEATAAVLTELHDISRTLPADDPGHGLIHGWNESDSCLNAKPMTWWQPYFANSAMAVRGLRDISLTWKGYIATDPKMEKLAGEWSTHSQTLSGTLLQSIEKNIRRDMNPPYIGPLPGAKLTFRESMAQEHPSPQGWPHRAYAELVHADVLPPKLANLVIDCMRAYGVTTLGVVANVGRPNPHDRDILGFISYGYALQLLRLDRIEEYLLFLYSHRFHDHTRGSWTAGEVAGITGGTAIFCIPAQLTIPMLVRWMMVFEDSDEDRLYLGKALPKDWVISGKEISIEKAPTRWGRVDFRMVGKASSQVVATVALAADRRAPKEVHVKFRLPAQNVLQTVAVNGRPLAVTGVHKDTVVIAPGEQKHLEVTAQYS
jgi:hypothetical protein